jgi:DNA-binding MarR family transcriptional regulator
MAEHVKRLFAAEESERLVEQVIEARRLRTSVFEPSLFSDPAWDILLTLYRSELRHEALRIDELAKAIGLTPASTARWLDALGGAGLIRRWSENEESRPIELTANGASGMRRWFGLWLNGSDNVEVGGLLDRLLDTRALKGL